MSDVSTNLIVQRIQRFHSQLLGVTKGLGRAQLARRLAPTATPAAWHLWHISRWADRLQASCPNRTVPSGQRWDPGAQIWIREQLAAKWGLKSAELGVLESGPGMTDDYAAVVAAVGKDALLDYATRAFKAADDAVVKLGAIADEPRTSIQEYRIDNAQVAEADGARVSVASDLAFHLSHAGRHLGCIEALRGMLGERGTATA